MTKETLQKLIDVHNTLYNITVTGNAIIPMAQALTALRAIIMENASVAQEDPSDTEDKN